MIDRKAAKNMAKVLVKASGLNKSSFLGLQRKNRQKRNRDDEQGKKQRLSDLFGRFDENLCPIPGPSLLPPSVPASYGRFPP